MSALSIYQRHSSRREHSNRGVSGPYYERNTSSSFKVLTEQRSSILFAAHYLGGE